MAENKIHLSVRDTIEYKALRDKLNIKYSSSMHFITFISSTSNLEQLRMFGQMTEDNS